MRVVRHHRLANAVPGGEAGSTGQCAMAALSSQCLLTLRTLVACDDADLLE